MIVHLTSLAPVYMLGTLVSMLLCHDCYGGSAVCRLIFAFFFLQHSGCPHEKATDGGSANPWNVLQVFGERGVHSRSAVGTNALPMNVPVEIEAIVEFADPEAESAGGGDWKVAGRL